MNEALSAWLRDTNYEFARHRTINPGRNAELDGGQLSKERAVTPVDIHPSLRIPRRCLSRIESLRAQYAIVASVLARKSPALL